MPTRMRIAFAAIIIFAFRATPGVGDGYRWFTIDVLGFDEAFFGVLEQMGAGVAIVAAWMLSDAVTRNPVAQVLLWLTILGTIFSLPCSCSCSSCTRHGRCSASAHAAWRCSTRRPHRRWPAQYDPPADLDCRLCPSGASGHVVRADGLAHESGAGRRRHADQVPELIFPVDRGDYGNLPASCWPPRHRLGGPLRAFSMFGRRGR